MTNYRILLCAALALSSAALSSHADSTSTQAQLPFQPVYTADSFTSFVGLNASPFERYLDSGPFKGAGTRYPPETFFDLGVRHYRTGLKNDLTLADQPMRVSDAYKKYGAQAMLLLDPGKDGSMQDVVDRLKLYLPGSVDLLEGPNEVNNKFPPQELDLRYMGKTDEAAGSEYMNDVYTAVKGDPATKSIGVVAYTAIFTDYHLARPCQSFDFANMHSYQGYGIPSSSLESNELRSNNLLPDGALMKRFIPTECGYNVQADKANGTNGTGTLRAQAFNIPMLLSEYFRHGIKRAYLFALHNADGYGLLEDDQVTKRPSYFALQSLMSAVKDANWDPATLQWRMRAFRPRALLFSMAGAPETVHTLTLQKQNGQYLLLIWNELPNFGNGKDILNPPVSLNITFRSRLSSDAEVLTQNDSGRYDTQRVQINDGVLRMDARSAVTIVRLTPVTPFGLRLASPTSLDASTTENSVHLSWNAPVGRPKPAGYFVYRNGDFLTATSRTFYDDLSPWVVAGLGYTYSVQSFDYVGDLSVQATVLATTPNKRPDLICSKMILPTVHAGDRVAFRATVQNVGDGATPHDTPAAITFFVDGKYASYAVTDGTPILAGESRQLVAGGLWTAPAGSHTIEAQVDDIDRIPEERSKSNNYIDRTLRVDITGAGVLDGSADPAPGAVELSREGTLDWAAWGLGGKNVCNRNAGGPNDISDMRFVGSGYYDTTPGCPMAASWTNGAPTTTTSGSHSGLWLNGVGHGYCFDVPADSTLRILRVYVAGLEGAGCTLVAHLSDSSAPDYVSSTFDGNLAQVWAPVPDGFAGMYTIRYRAATPDQKLTVTWKLSSEPNRFLGQARLQAATLARGD